MKNTSGLNLFKRAFLNVFRTKAKSIILILTFFLIGNFVIIGLGVSNAAENAKVLTRKKMRAVVSCEANYDKIYQYLDTLSEEEQNTFWQENRTSLKYQDLQNFMNDERVSTIQASSYSRSIDVKDKESFKYVPIDNEAEKDRQESGDNQRYSSDFFLKTNLFPNCIELLEGTFSMVDGEFYSDDDIKNANDVIVITKQLADLNNIKIGDKVVFSLGSAMEIEEMTNMVPDLKPEHYYMELTIKGIYDHTNILTPDRDDFAYLQPYENPDNTCLMPATTLQKYVSVYEDIMNNYYDSMEGMPVVYNEVASTEEAVEDVEVAVADIAAPVNDTITSNNVPSANLINSIPLSNVKIFLNDPLDVDDFVSENESALPEFFYFNANNDEFKNLSKPLDTLSMYSNLIIWLVVVNAIVIITLVVALTLKTREYEIGVLLSIGASKIKIVLQFFTELAIVALIGFTLSTISGSIISSKIGNTVLDYQIQRDELDKTDDYYYYDSVWNEDYFTHITLDDLVSEYDSSVSPFIIMEIYIMGLGIVFISTLIPALMIMRFNPKKILMNQN